MNSLFKKDGTVNGIGYSKAFKGKGVNMPSRIQVSLKIEGNRTVRAFRIQQIDLKETYQLAVNLVADLNGIDSSSPEYRRMVDSLERFSEKHGLIEERVKNTVKSTKYESTGLDASIQNIDSPLSLMAGLLNQYGLPHGIYFSNESINNESEFFRPAVIQADFKCENGYIRTSFSTKNGIEDAYRKACEKCIESKGLSDPRLLVDLAESLCDFRRHYKIIESQESIDTYSFRVTSKQERAANVDPGLSPL